MNLEDIKLSIVGLGYVGLPLAVEFGRKRAVVGFDINQRRIDELRAGNDFTLETTQEELAAAKHLSYTTNLDDLRTCNCYIVTVPTPIDEHKRPDLSPLIKASETVGKVLKKGDIVIYESTVYPGCTEEDCVPILEKYSGLKFNQDFFCGYSPERINPGDKEHRVTTIKKITSGSTPEIADLVDALYNEIITVGTHKADSIKVAEAAKVIENTQRVISTDVLKCYPFPEFAGETFITEGVVWNRIACSYKTRFVNERLKIVEYLPDGLSASTVRIRANSPQGTRLYYDELSRLSIPLIAKTRALINYVRFSFHGGIPVYQMVKNSASPTAAAILLIIGYLMYKADRCKL